MNPPDAERTDRPLTVLHVCSIKGRGGTGYMASHLCRLLARRGHRVIVANPPGGKVAERARADGLETLDDLTLARGFRPRTLWRDVRRLRRILRDENVHIAHAWHSIEYWSLALAIPGTGARLARTRGLVTPIRGHLFNRILHNRTAAVFATCGRIVENYRAAGLRTGNVFYLPDGVDTERFRPGNDGAPLRAELGLSPETPLVVNVGRMAAVKGQETFLRALAALPADVHAAVAGDGEERPALEALARELGIDRRVHFLGVRADIPAVLAAADVYVLCSVGSEGSSRATLEAMAAGLPCVTTTVGMLPDIVKPGRTGLLFRPGEAGELAECVENLVKDAGLRRRLGKAAREYVERHHAEAVMARTVESVYRTALEGA